MTGQRHGQGGAAGDGPGRPGYSCQVFRAAALTVFSGANSGDAIGGLDAVCLGDVYHLARDAQPCRLSLLSLPAAEGGGAPRQTVATGSEAGSPGGEVVLCARLTLMAPEGDTIELQLLRDEGGEQDFVLPLSPLAPGTDYTLIRASADAGAVRLSDLVCISFGRGTQITLADGRQAAIETLEPGDRVLTRDRGPQPVRWIGRATLRAQGSNAPVLISAGTMGNTGDLVVGQHHRMFLYQRGGARLVETAEVLVQARHFVDGERVFLRPGGYVDYFSLVFDRHEIIYAEGIPAESLMVNEATLLQLPDGLAEEVKARFPGLSQHQHFGTEAGRRALDGLAPAELYRQGRIG